ncbi:MAG: NAD(P)-dependent glycerol-3-phosphate dehydrogenase [Candidatus Nitrohelix vancouverensis]|uniref:Glycerol-3-phosphate dehydrogenase [NAD(P)+] n=1 Tax=Candidatus Nitrohelix vancouverensis TaxID=2705534 RepID=A0A7T0G449_9BACT|nr:MAG: NAD(P)-dependent glycerol-3-phosphate dehydrogenase [Candidatus Nitrohelix vancouverensis]
MRNTKLAVLGAGSWGTALSINLAKRLERVDLWVYEKDLFDLIETTRENSYFLPGVPLPSAIHPTHSLKEAVAGKEILLLAIPTHFIRETLATIQPFLAPNCLIVNAGKGIENDTLCVIHEIIEQILGSSIRTATISGPTFAAEIAQDAPSALVAAAKTMADAEIVQELFNGPDLRVFASNDLIGVETGGALKNVIAIAAGISDGLGLGHNARAALITRGLVEISRIGTAMGARPETFSGLSGLGDLVLTCTGDLSRNRSVGIKLGQGQSLAEITGGMKMVAEGVRTVKSARDLKNKFGLQASVIEETYQILYENKPPSLALRDLMKVNITSEFSGVKGLP